MDKMSGSSDRIAKDRSADFDYSSPRAKMLSMYTIRGQSGKLLRMNVPE